MLEVGQADLAELDCRMGSNSASIGNSAITSSTLPCSLHSWLMA